MRRNHGARKPEWRYGDKFEKHLTDVAFGVMGSLGRAVFFINTGDLKHVQHLLGIVTNKLNNLQGEISEVIDKQEKEKKTGDETWETEGVSKSGVEENETKKEMQLMK